MSLLTESEMAVIDALAEAYNAFTRLPTTHPSDAREFEQGIHVLQRIVMSRPVREEITHTQELYFFKAQNDLSRIVQRKD